MSREQSFPIPIEIYRRYIRNTHTSLDVMLEKTLMITRTWMEIVNYQIRGSDSQDFRYWKRNHQMGTRAPGRD